MKTLAILIIAMLAVPATTAQVMPNPKEMSGSVLPVGDLPAGTVSVRVIRGNFDKNLPNQTVEFTVDGAKRTARTNETGRAEVRGLTKGAKVRAVVTVDGERLESQEAVVGDTGLRIILVATDPDVEKRAEEDRRLAAAAPVKGIVVLGPDSQIIAQMSDDRLNIYYDMQIVNSARTPVDIGGPFIVDLPREARSTTILEDSSPQATANGPRITVTGPFAPGVTLVRAAYELPYSGGSARIEQRWPAAMQQLNILAEQTGGLKLESSQLTSNREVVNDGRPVIFGSGPGLAAGQPLTLVLSGLPERSRWPRNVALALAGLIVAAGFIGAFTAPRRRTA